jgi:hypothetical protein
MRTGARWLREPFKWDAVQPARGRWDWSRYDATMAAASRRGLHVIANLYEVPGWAGRAWNQVPADPTAFARYAAAVARRYGPKGTFWRAHPRLRAVPVRHLELWNEPYFDYYSLGGVKPGRYARLVRATAKAVRRANRGVKIMLEADSVGSDDPRGFTADMYRAVPDLNRWFDYVAIHPYSEGRSPLLRNDRYGFQHIGAVRADFVRRGAGRKPVWITEIGWSSCAAGAAADCVDEHRQAAYLRDVFKLLNTKFTFVQGIVVYHLTDQNGPGDDREAYFGLIRTNGTAKPAFYALRALAKR